MSYIERYVSWASKLTIAPKEYHIATALAHLSAIVNRNASVMFARKPLYPNLWILVTGKTRVSKKSTATEDIGKEKIFLAVDDKYLLPDDITPPKLFQLLDERTKDGNGGRGIMYVDEIGGFFSKLSKADYMEGGKDFLCNLYNNPSLKTKATKKDGILTIKDAYLVILGNTTEERLSAVLKTEDITNGFLIRHLLFNAPIPENNYETVYEDESGAQEKEAKELIEWLQKLRDTLREHHVKMKLSDEANKIYIEYQKYIDQEIINNNKQHLAELPNQLIKIAMLVELSMLSIESMMSIPSILSIKESSILKALEILKPCELTLTATIDSIDTSTVNQLADKIEPMLSDKPQHPRDFQRRIYNAKITPIMEALRKLSIYGIAKKIEEEGYVRSGAV